MTTARTAAIAVAGTSLLQLVLGLALERLALFRAILGSVISESTKHFDANGITGFFHPDKDGVGGRRLADVTRIAALGAVASSLMVAVLVAIIGLAVTMVVGFMTTPQHTLWALGSLVLLLLLVFLAIMFQSRVAQGKLLDYRLDRPDPEKAWRRMAISLRSFDMPTPYRAAVLLTNAFVVVASIFIA
jgi:hypothetical protein